MHLAAKKCILLSVILRIFGISFMLMLSWKRIGDRNGIFIVGIFYCGRSRTFGLYSLQTKGKIPMAKKQIDCKNGRTAVVFGGASLAAGGVGLSV